MTHNEESLLLSEAAMGHILEGYPQGCPCSWCLHDLGAFGYAYQYSHGAAIAPDALAIWLTANPTTLGCDPEETP